MRLAHSSPSFLWDYFSKEWPQVLQKDVPGLYKTVKRLKEDLHLKGTKKEFAVPRFLK